MQVPVIGVIEPGVRAAAAVLSADGTTPPPQEKNSAEILVLATAATVQSRAYQRACAALGRHAAEKACPLLVPLVEEGWTNHPVTREVIDIYLREALGHCAPRAVLLGCTHYPLIEAAIEHALRELGSQAAVIDSAQATADAVAETLGKNAASAREAASSTFECFATDSVEKFQRLGSLFLEQPIADVHLLDLGG
jgi:glutamate racemase